LLALLLTTVAPQIAATAEKPDAKSGVLWVYVGTYTKAPETGINFCRFDIGSGSLSKPAVVAKTPNPTFLALHGRRPLLYAINEVSDFENKKVGSVSAFRIEPKTGKLDLINQQSTGGPGPCHVSVDRTGQVVLTANYLGGSVASLPLRADGGLNPAATVDQHHGSSVIPSRQTGPFGHCIEVDPNNHFALSADLGIDKILIYKLDAAHGALAPNEPAFAETPRGAGPRHLTFHPNGRFVYAINELSSTISVFRYDSVRGALESVQDISTLPANFAGKSTAAEIQVHPSGRFLYGSNRGHDSIAIFAIDPDTGKLGSLGHEPTQGKTPRNFTLDPSGRYLLAANQDTNNVVVFRVDPESGLLKPAGVSVAIPAPVCVVMMPPVE
jgi:6-phosphogluconolactonase